jgi:hypothetical protein
VARRRGVVDHDSIERRLEVARCTLEYAHRFGDEPAVDLSAMDAVALRAHATSALRSWPTGLRGAAHQALAHLDQVDAAARRSASWATCRRRSSLVSDG